MQTLPPGHFACPRCRGAVLSGAPVCPNCGADVRPAPTRRAYSGLVLLVVGLAVVLAAGGGFVVNCFNMVSNIGVSTGSERYAPIFQLCVGAGADGLLLMLAGLVLAIVQLTRKG